ncbi:MAG: histidine kinase [Actinomycetes bacterium]
MPPSAETTARLKWIRRAVPYLCALPPMVFFGGVLVWVVLRHPDFLWNGLSDVALGLIALGLLALRRRFPVVVAVVTVLTTLVSTTATGPAAVAYVSLAKRRPLRRFFAVAALTWVCMASQLVTSGITQQTYISLLAGTAFYLGLTGVALYLRGREEVAASQRAAALAAEREQRQRIEQARLAERAKIAQEMHDVLAHRISLLSMLAGGLAYRTDLSPEEMRATAQLIQENAHQSLTELRAVLGTLRADTAAEGDGEAAVAPPQPTLADLEKLFDEVRAAGQKLEVHDRVSDREALPTQTGRHAYRIVQEALTNARKHAPGSRVTAELDGRPGEGLRIRVSNPVLPGTPAGPGARLGLVGLSERVRMAGGTMSHAIEDGRFVLDVRLPWEA